MEHVRTYSLERGVIDKETGRFPMTLATDGEAFDGDILSIQGAQVDQRLPLQASHINDPTQTLGSITEFVKEAHKLKAMGQIEMSGEGFMAEMRQGIAHLMEKGHVGAVSIRWDPIKMVRRVNLPSDHPAFIKEDETDFRKRYGVFYEKWRALEGSIVAVGADPKALIGRADLCGTDEAKSFFRSMAASAEAPEPNYDPSDTRMASIEMLQRALKALKESGITDHADLINLLTECMGPNDYGDASVLSVYTYGDGRQIHFPHALYTELVGESVTNLREAQQVYKDAVQKLEDALDLHGIEPTRHDTEKDDEPVVDDPSGTRDLEADEPEASLIPVQRDVPMTLTAGQMAHEFREVMGDAKTQLTTEIREMLRDLRGQ